MTNAEIARKIREAIYERSNDEGGAISREQMDEAIEGALVKMAPTATAPVTRAVYTVNGVYEIDGILLDPSASILITGVD